MKKIITVLFSIGFLLAFFYYSDSYEYSEWKFLSVIILYLTFVYIVKKNKISTNIPIVTMVVLYVTVLVSRSIIYSKELFTLLNFGFLFCIIFIHLLFTFSLKSRFTYKVLSCGLLAVFIFFFSFFMNSMVANKLVFGNFNGNYDYTVKEDVVVSDAHGNSKKLENDKTYVLDLWNKGCGVCFIKFPKFEKLKNRYRDNKSVEFVALNVYNRPQDIALSQKLFESRHLDLKTYYISSAKAAELQTSLFPTIIVLKKGKIVFKGSVETLSIFGYKYF